MKHIVPVTDLEVHNIQYQGFLHNRLNAGFY
jgi:hypothetical protein